MGILKIIIVSFLLVTLIGMGAFLIAGPGMIEKFMNKVLAHPPYKISQAAQKKI